MQTERNNVSEPSAREWLKARKQNSIRQLFASNFRYAYTTGLMLLVTWSASAFANSARQNRVLAAYYPEWGVYRSFYAKTIASNDSASMANVLIYAFASIKNNRCSAYDPWADYQMSYVSSNSVDGVPDSTVGSGLRGNFNQLRKLKAAYPSLKVLISIGGYNGSAPFPSAANAVNRQAFVASCIDMYIGGKFAAGVNGPGIFDGIDIDWEYPGTKGSADYTELLAEFRRQLDATRQGLLLAAATPGGRTQFSQINLAGISPYLNFFNIMTYDYDGPWSNETGFTAPLYRAPGDPWSDTVDSTIQAYLQAGVPVDKLLLGVSFYGYLWNNVPDNGTHGLFQPGAPTKNAPNYSYPYIFGLPGLTRYREPVSTAEWLYDGSNFWTVDDPIAIARKTQYASVYGLVGMMVWDLQGDTQEATLFRTIANNLGITIDTSLYAFEGGLQGWTGGPGISSVLSSSAVAYSGTRSLAVGFNANSFAPKSQVYVPSPPISPGSKVEFHIWIPANSDLSAVNPFVEDGNYVWADNWQSITGLVPNAWNKVAVTVPTTARAPFARLGVEFTSAGAWSGSCYLDSVDSSSHAPLYSFETGIQAWSSRNLDVKSTTALAFDGARSLAVSMNSGNFAPKSQVYVRSPLLQPGATIQFHVWVPQDSALSAIDAFVEDNNWTWFGDWRSTASLLQEGWNTFQVTVPKSAATPIQELGVEFTSNATWAGTIYIDDIGP